MSDRTTPHNTDSQTQVQADLPFAESTEIQSIDFNHKSTSASSRVSSNLPWYRDGVALLFINFLLLLLCLGLMFYFAGEMDVKQSLIIVQHDSCDYLQQKGLPLQQLENGTCKTEVPFRQNLMGTGGRVFLGDSVIKLGDFQVIGAIALEGQPYTERQLNVLMLFLGSILILILFTWWTVHIINTQSEEDAE